MAITFPSTDPGIKGLIVLPDNRAQLRAKLAVEARARHESDAAVAVLMWENDRLRAELADAHEHIDQLATAWAKTIRPSTAERRARVWAAKGTVLADRVAGIFASRARINT